MRRCLRFLIFLAAIPAPDGRAGERPPVLSRIVPPGATVGGRQVWTLEGENLGRVERVVVEGNDLAFTIQGRTDRTLTVEARAEPDAIPGFRRLRVDGPDGISNPRIVRVDRLAQTLEQEPNDRFDRATPIRWKAAAVGELKPCRTWTITASLVALRPGRS